MNGNLPHHLRGFSRGDLEDNIAVRIGEVYERVLPDDDRNSNKKFDEYSVFVEEMVDGVPSTRLYKNCTVISQFGGLADKTHHSYRGEKAASTKKGVGKGSKVLVVCINGTYKNGVIIGGIRDFQDGPDKDDDRFKGHHYYWVFNGVEAFINEDGEYTLTYKGKTESDGKRNKDVKDSVVGSIFSLLKDGIIKQVAIKEWNVDVSNGKAIITATDGLHIGSASDKMMLGSTYRDAESSMNQDTQTGYTNIVTKMAAVAAAIQSAAVAQKVPISGPVVAAPFLDTASQLLVQIVQDIQKMAQSVAKFEAQADKYLSTKHKIGDPK
jgi:hypothetical protein